MNERIEDLVAEFIERREAGEAIEAQDFVAAYPEEAPGLKLALKALAGAEASFPESSSVFSRPRTIGDWRILSELGRGGMGQVFRVARVGNEDEVRALKWLGPLSSLRPHSLERFQRESSLLARLSHEGIVRVHEVGEDDGRPYLVMDEVRGLSLAELLDQARADGGQLQLPGEGTREERIATLVARLARALAAAQAQGLLHRDIKPSNVLLNQAGQPVLIDFGLAADDESASLTGSGDLLGTPRYMSPEQARGERTDRRTDVYGVGTVLYELLTLRPPHAGTEALEVIDAVRRRPVVGVQQLAPEVPDALANITRKALSKRPARRYADAASLAQDLENFRAGEAVQACGRGAPERAEDMLRYHPGKLLSLGIVGLLALVASVLARPSEADLELRRQAGLRAASVAWFDGRDTLAAAVAMLEKVGGDAERLAFLRHRRAVPYAGTHALVAALIEKDYETAIQLDPEWVLPVALLGRAAKASGSLERALAELRGVHRSWPESVGVTLDLAEVLHDLGEAQEACEVLRAGITLDRGHWLLWAKLAKVLYGMQAFEEGLAATQEALRLAPEQTDKLLKRHAVLLSANGQGRPARELMLELLKDNPGDANLLYNLAYSHDLDCQLEQSRERYEQSIELEPDSAKALSALAWLYSGSGRETCDKCAVLFDANPALEDMGRSDELMVRAIHADRGASQWLGDMALAIAARTGTSANIADALRQVADESPEVTPAVVRIERALRRLLSQ